MVITCIFDEYVLVRLCRVWRTLERSGCRRVFLACCQNSVLCKEPGQLSAGATD